MNVLSWNCRGTAAKGFVSLLRDLQRKFDTKFCILMETHTSGEKARSIIKRIELDAVFVLEAQGQAGGI